MPVILEARNPKYVREDNSLIDLEIRTSGVQDVSEDEWIRFTANPNDIEPHGRTLYQMAVNGDFGLIEPFET